MREAVAQARILVVDGERALGTRVAVALGDGLCAPARCRDLPEALRRLEREAFDLVVACVPSASGAGPLPVDAAFSDVAGAASWLWLGEPHPALAQDGPESGAPAVDWLEWGVPDSVLASVIRLLIERRLLRDRLDTLEACRPLLLCLEPGKVYSLALDLLLKLTGRTRGIALFRREAVPQGDSIAVRGFSEPQTARLCEALLEEKPVDVEAFGHIGIFDRGGLHEGLRLAGLEVAELLVAPLHGQESEAGLAALFEEGRPFSAIEIERAAAVADHAEVALRNAETYLLAKERAFIDDVTEIYNARYLLSTTENEIQRAERYGNPLSVVFLDLDRFKLVNDRYGHLVGSETLRRLSRLLLDCVRQVDTVARYGGDEFTVLLVDTGHAEALRVAERIRRTVEEHVFEPARDVHLKLTISLGVATCPDQGRERDGLLDMADKAMYRAKSLGRNRVCSAADLDA